MATIYEQYVGKSLLTFIIANTRLTLNNRKNHRISLKAGVKTSILQFNPASYILEPGFHQASRPQGVDLADLQTGIAEYFFSFEF